jgi:hypothetical protein
MPKGQTPKQRRFRKETKPLRKAVKTLSGMGSLMSQGMSATAAKNLMKKAKELKPSGRISKSDLDRVKDIMQKKPPKFRPTAPNRATPQEKKKLMDRLMEKGPRPMGRPKKSPLGPLRPITERSQSKLTSRRRGMAEDFKRSRLGRPKGTRAK